MEKFYIVKEGSRLHTDYWEWRNSVSENNKIVIGFFEQHGIEATRYWMVDLLTKHNATVLWCNSHTKAFDLEGYILTADVIISATGKPQLIKKIRDDQIVIDVGICRGEDGKLCGDVDKSCYGEQMLITPVPGGVGLMTRVSLLENLVYGGN